MFLSLFQAPKYQIMQLLRSREIQYFIYCYFLYAFLSFKIYLPICAIIDFFKISFCLGEILRTVETYHTLVSVFSFHIMHKLYLLINLTLILCIFMHLTWKIHADLCFLLLIYKEHLRKKITICLTRNSVLTFISLMDWSENQILLWDHFGFPVMTALGLRRSPFVTSSF